MKINTFIMRVIISLLGLGNISPLFSQTNNQLYDYNYQRQITNKTIPDCSENCKDAFTKFIIDGYRFQEKNNNNVSNEMWSNFLNNNQNNIYLVNNCPCISGKNGSNNGMTNNNRNNQNTNTSGTNVDFKNMSVNQAINYSTGVVQSAGNSINNAANDFNSINNEKNSKRAAIYQSESSTVYDGRDKANLIEDYNIENGAQNIFEEEENTKTNTIGSKPVVYDQNGPLYGNIPIKWNKCKSDVKTKLGLAESTKEFSATKESEVINMVNNIPGTGFIKSAKQGIQKKVSDTRELLNTAADATPKSVFGLRNSYNNVLNSADLMSDQKYEEANQLNDENVIKTIENNTAKAYKE